MGGQFPVAQALSPHSVTDGLDTILSGTAVIQGISGADWYLINTGTLPDCYITKLVAEGLG